jgi:hypothetical protein
VKGRNMEGFGVKSKHKKGSVVVFEKYLKRKEINP